MKNYMVLMISLLVLSKTGIAQTPKDSTVNKKNEFNVDLIPLIKWASMSEGVFDIKGTIQYKRQLKSHVFLRFSVTGVQQRVDREFTNIRVYPAIYNYDQVYYTGTKYKPQLQLNTGLEYRWGKRRIKQFAGVDIGYVHKERVYTDYSTTVPRYVSYDPNNFVYNYVSSPDSTAPYSNRNNDIVSSYAEKINGVSITPFYGVQYHFSRHFFFSMQVGLPMQMLWVHNKPISGPSFMNSNAAEFDLGEGGILNNFSLGFRF